MTKIPLFLPHEYPRLFFISISQLKLANGKHFASNPHHQYKCEDFLL